MLFLVYTQMHYSWHFLQEHENVMLIPLWSCCHHLLVLNRVTLHGGKWWQLPRVNSLSKRDVKQAELRQRNTLHMNTEPQVREPACVPTQPLCDQGKSQASPCHRLPAYKMEKTPSSWECEELYWELFAFLAGGTWASIVLSSQQDSSKEHMQI